MIRYQKAQNCLSYEETFREGLSLLVDLKRLDVRQAQKIAQAFNFTKLHHGDQKWGDHPYIIHLIRTFIEVESYTVALKKSIRTPCLIASLLHDVLEDTSAPPEDLMKTFGPEVAFIVEKVTDPKEGTRAQKKKYIYDNLKHSFGAAIVKLCDRKVNVMLTLDDMAEGKDSFKYLKIYTKEQTALKEAVDSFINPVPVIVFHIDQLLSIANDEVNL